jgi:hypothetical protein
MEEDAQTSFSLRQEVLKILDDHFATIRDATADEVVALMKAKMDQARVEEAARQVKRSKVAASTQSKSKSKSDALDPNSTLRMLTEIRRRPIDQQELCFKCASSSTECPAQKHHIKHKKNLKVNELLKAYVDTADCTTSNGCITSELRNHWLCGRHLSSNSQIDNERLAQDYRQVCDLLSQPINDIVLEKLQKAALLSENSNSKRRVTGKSRKINHVEEHPQQPLKEDFNAPQPIEEDFNAPTPLKDFKAPQPIEDDFNAPQPLEEDFKAPQPLEEQAEEEDHPEEKEDAPLASEIVQNDAVLLPLPQEMDVGEDEILHPDESEIRAILSLQQPNHLKKLNTMHLVAIYTTQCPDQDLQVITCDDSRKLCVAVAVPIDEKESARLYCGFYGEKYTLLKNADVGSEHTTWLPCNVPLFMSAGLDKKSAEIGYQNFVRIANRICEQLK